MGSFLPTASPTTLEADVKRAVVVLETAGPGAKDLESAEFNVFNMVFCSFRHFAGSFLYEAQAWGNTPLKPLLNKGQNSQI